MNAEDSNFSLFNYANLLSSQIEKLELEIGELKAEYEMLKAGGSGEISDTSKKSKHV